MSDEQIMSIIKEFRAGMPVPSSPKWPDIEFDKAAYSLWAADELIMYIQDHREIGVYKAIYAFKDMMLDYSCVLTHYSDANFMFDVAHDLVESILDVLAAAS